MKNHSSAITKFEATDSGISVVARSTSAENENELYAEDAIYFSPRVYTKYMMIRAILYGVQIESSTIMFKEDEYEVEITEDGDIKVKIQPSSETSKMAFNKLVEQILSDIYMASRSISTSSIRRATEKLGIETKIENDANDSMAKIEKSMTAEKMKVAIFSLAKEKNIQIVELQNKSIELTGKKSSAQWTVEDAQKMLDFVKNYKTE